MADVEINVVDLDISQVVGHGLGHRSRAGGHQPVPVPEAIVESIPGGFEELEAPRQVGAQLGCGAARGESRGTLRAVPGGVEAADPPGRRTPHGRPAWAHCPSPRGMPSTAAAAGWWAWIGCCTGNRGW